MTTKYTDKISIFCYGLKPVFPALRKPSLKQTPGFTYIGAYIDMMYCILYSSQIRVQAW